MNMCFDFADIKKNSLEDMIFHLALLAVQDCFLNNGLAKCCGKKSVKKSRVNAKKIGQKKVEEPF